MKYLTFNLIVSSKSHSLILFGGADLSYSNIYNDLWELDLDNLVWTPLPSSPSPPPRFGHSSIAIEGALMVLFGISTSDSSHSPQPMLWDPSNGSWTNSLPSKYVVPLGSSPGAIPSYIPGQYNSNSVLAALGGVGGVIGIVAAVLVFVLIVACGALGASRGHRKAYLRRSRRIKFENRLHRPKSNVHLENNDEYNDGPATKNNIGVHFDDVPDPDDSLAPPIFGTLGRSSTKAVEDKGGYHKMLKWAASIVFCLDDDEYDDELDAENETFQVKTKDYVEAEIDVVENSVNDTSDLRTPSSSDGQSIQNHVIEDSLFPESFLIAGRAPGGRLAEVILERKLSRVPTHAADTDLNSTPTLTSSDNSIRGSISDSNSNDGKYPRVDYIIPESSPKSSISSDNENESDTSSTVNDKSSVLKAQRLISPLKTSVSSYSSDSSSTYSNSYASSLKIDSSPSLKPTLPPVSVSSNLGIEKMSRSSSLSKSRRKPPPIQSLRDTHHISSMTSTHSSLNSPAGSSAQLSPLTYGFSNPSVTSQHKSAFNNGIYPPISNSPSSIQNGDNQLEVLPWEIPGMGVQKPPSARRASMIVLKGFEPLSPQDLLRKSTSNNETPSLVRFNSVNNLSSYSKR